MSPSGRAAFSWFQLPRSLLLQALSRLLMSLMMTFSPARRLYHAVREKLPVTVSVPVTAQTYSPSSRPETISTFIPSLRPVTTVCRT